MQLFTLQESLIVFSRNRLLSISSLVLKCLYKDHSFVLQCSFLQQQTERKKVKSLSRVWLFVTPCTVAYQAPSSMEFSRQEYWNGLPFPSPGDLPNPGIEPQVSCIAGRCFTIWATREAPNNNRGGRNVHGIYSNQKENICDTFKHLEE